MSTWMPSNCPVSLAVFYSQHALMDVPTLAEHASRLHHVCDLCVWRYGVGVGG